MNATNEEELNNYKNVKKQLTEALKNNKNILIEGGLGLGRKNLIEQWLIEYKDANEVIVEVNLPESNKVTFGTYHGANHIEETKEEKQHKLVQHMINEKAQILVIETEKGCDISMYLEVAKLLETPLLVSIVTSSNKVNIKMFDTIQKLSAEVDNINVDHKASVLDKIKELKSNTVEDSKAKKLTN